MKSAADQVTGYTGEKRRVNSGALFSAPSSGAKSIRSRGVKSGLTSSAIAAGSKGSGSGSKLVGESSVDFGSEIDTFSEGRGIDEAGIRAVIRRNRMAFSSCYESVLLRGRQVVGKMTLIWFIEEGGRVRRVLLSPRSQLKSQDLFRCVSARLKTWIFPEPPDAEPVKVTYPFTFKLKSKS